jgi:trans-2-enoyl-CoA reductase
MKTLESTKTRKVKTIEVKYSNMTFIVQSYSHFITTVKKPDWSKNKYTATIKETNEEIGVVGGRDLIKKQMELINSRPDLFLK